MGLGVRTVAYRARKLKLRKPKSEIRKATYEELYELLAERDPDFSDYFKVVADFGIVMDRTDENEISRQIKIKQTSVKTKQTMLKAKHNLLNKLLFDIIKPLYLIFFYIIIIKFFRAF